MKNKEINYKPLGRYILVKTKDKTEGGLYLPEHVKQTNTALEVALVADGINHIKPGDMVVVDAPSFIAWTIDKVTYYQIPEHQVIGIVLNGGSIEPTHIENFEPKDPQGHYKG